MTIPRWLNPRTNPTGYAAFFSFAYAVANAVTNQLHGGKVLTLPVIIGAVGTVGSVWLRHMVAPNADPRNALGEALMTKSDHDKAAFSDALASHRALPLPPVAQTFHADTTDMAEDVAQAIYQAVTQRFNLAPAGPPQPDGPASEEPLA